MKPLFYITGVVACGMVWALPVQAEEPAEPPMAMDQLDEWFNLLDQFTTQAQPMMEQFLEQMGPQLDALRNQIADWSLYEAPEILPNGDIIIRRKPSAEIDVMTNPDGTRDI